MSSHMSEFDITNLIAVKPGDLITAEWANNLTEIFLDMNQRISDLENNLQTTTGLRIMAFNPPPPPDGQGQALGQVMQLYGQNFAWPSQNNIVTIQNFGVLSGGTATIKQFRPGSSPTMLEFVVPTNIAGIQASGTDVTITINNGDGEAHKTYRLLPALPKTGQPPVISSIAKQDGTVILSVSQSAVIKGQNFSPIPSGNNIRIVIASAGGDIVYPDPTSGDPKRNQPIQITSTSSTEIQFTVPDIQEADINGIDVSVELQIGNFPSIERVVTVVR